LGALDWSWELLEPYEQAALAQLSVFEGGFSLDAAEVVIDLKPFDNAPFVMDVVESLVDKSLVNVTTPDLGGLSLETRRFGMLVSIQAYATAKLAGSDTLEKDSQGNPLVRADAYAATLERHGRCFAAMGTDEAIEALDGPGGLARMRFLTLELANLVAAAERARSGDVIFKTGAATYEIFSLQGPYERGVELLSRLLESERLSPIERSRLTGLRGRLRWRGWDQYGAREDLQAAWMLAHDQGDAWWATRWQGNLALLNMEQGQTRAARDAFLSVIERSHALGDVRTEHVNIGNLGVLDRNQGHLEDAQRRLSQAYATAQALGDRRGECFWLGQLAILDRHNGHVDQARQKYQRALRLAQRIGDRRREIFQRGNVANLDREQGHYNAARDGYLNVIELARQLGDLRSENINLGNLGSLDLMLNHLEAAAQSFERALILAQRLKDQRTESAWTGFLGALAVKRGELDTAREYLGSALSITERIDDKHFWAVWLGHLADIDRREGLLSDSSERFAKAEEILRAVNNRLALGKLLSHRGLLDLCVDNVVGACQALDEAQTIANDLRVTPESELAVALDLLRVTIQSHSA